MERHVLALAIGSGVLGILLGWAVGSRTNRARARLRRLEAELEASHAELQSYREHVTEHFSRTSDLLRDLTVQYRTVYDHLAEGARSLCPDRTTALGEGIEAALLSEENASSPKPETSEDASRPGTERPGS